MCPSRHSERSRTSRICKPSRRSASCSTVQRRMLATSRRSARQLVIPPARKPPSLRMPTALALLPAQGNLARCEREQLDARGEERALVEVDDGAEGGRLRPEPRERALEEAVLPEVAE